MPQTILHELKTFLMSTTTLPFPLTCKTAVPDATHRTAVGFCCFVTLRVSQNRRGCGCVSLLARPHNGGLHYGSLCALGGLSIRPLVVSVRFFFGRFCYHTPPWPSTYVESKGDQFNGEFENARSRNNPRKTKRPSMRNSAPLTPMFGSETRLGCWLRGLYSRGVPPHAPPLSAGLSTHHSVRRTRRYSTATAEAPSSNPLPIQMGLPKFAAIEADNVEPAVKQLLESLQADFDKLEARAETASG